MKRNLYRAVRILLSSLCILATSACQRANLEQLQPGQSSMTDVLSIMGHPVSEWAEDNGTTIWEYPQTPNGMVNYMLDFDQDKKLLAIRQVLTEENFAKIKAGMTQQEIRHLLGLPAHQLYFSLKKEHVWDWKVAESTDQTTFFNVHFTNDGKVTHTSRNTVPSPGS